MWSTCYCHHILLSAVKRAHNKLSNGLTDNSVQDLAVLNAFSVQCKLRRAPKILECYWSRPPLGITKANRDGSSRGNLTRSLLTKMDFYLEVVVNQNGFGVTTVFEVGTGVLTGLICELLLRTLVSLVEKKPHLERRIWRQRLLHSFCQLNRLMRIFKLQLNHHVLNLAVFLLVGTTSALTMNVVGVCQGLIIDCVFVEIKASYNIVMLTENWTLKEALLLVIFVTSPLIPVFVDMLLRPNYRCSRSLWALSFSAQFGEGRRENLAFQFEFGDVLVLNLKWLGLDSEKIGERNRREKTLRDCFMFEAENGLNSKFRNFVLKISDLDLIKYNG
ncbi:hypothetical protein IFM89_004797 [Coptis chinensis]|uniref:Uncharacterized protein n=1 Tax=Coptis chinensis TaxID=261450 RepID=A0A835IAJ3_9MAGN|nr:hypothetical protein IFM89_004797 [Coptis chinensis]